MRVVCVLSRTSALPDHQRGRFLELEERYPITPGNSYVVAGLGLWENRVMVLIEDDDRLPSWCPLALFETGSTQKVPEHWRFVLTGDIRRPAPEMWTKWMVKCGYAELVEDDSHIGALIDGDPAALDLFRREIDHACGAEDG